MHRRWLREKRSPKPSKQPWKSAGLLVMNKSHSVQKEQREQIAYGLPKCPILWVENGRIPLKSLPAADMKDIHPVDKSLIYKDIIQVGSVFTDPGIPIQQAQLQPEGWSVGWRWHASRQFDESLARVAEKPRLAARQAGCQGVRGLVFE